MAENGYIMAFPICLVSTSWTPMRIEYPALKMEIYFNTCTKLENLNTPEKVGFLLEILYVKLKFYFIIALNSKRNLRYGKRCLLSSVFMLNFILSLK